MIFLRRSLTNLHNNQRQHSTESGVHRPIRPISLGHFVRGRIRQFIRGNPQFSVGQHHFNRAQRLDGLHCLPGRLKHGARLTEDVCVCVRIDADT